MIVLQKPCERCGTLIIKPPSCSRANWPKRRYCSYECMGLANRGKPSWNAGLKGYNAYPRPPQWRSNISAALKGRPIPQCRGPSHHNWKDGISKTRRDLRELSYVTWREALFARDDFTCRWPECGQRGGDLEAHHIETWSARPDLRYDANNGVTLCKRHHAMTKGREQAYANACRQMIGFTRS